MVVFQFTIHQGKKQAHVNMDILTREDALPEEIKCAKTLEKFFLETLKQVAKDKKMELKIEQVKARK